VNSREALDPSLVTRFLRERFEAVGGVEAIAGGEWSQAFAFRADERDYVVRFGAFRDDYEKDRVAFRYEGPDLPIPEVLGVGDAFGGGYALSTRVYGQALDTLDEAGYRQALPSVFRMLNAMRTADVSWTTGYGMWEPQGSAPYGSWREMLLDVQHDREGSRTHGWWELLSSAPRAAEAFRAGYRVLEALAAGCPEERHLIHSDIVGDNVRVLRGKVTGVVDWGNAMYGDFLYDLARLDFWRPWYPELEGVDVLGEAERYFRSVGVMLPDFAERVRCCEVHIGLDAQAYNAFTRRWGELERSGARTLEIAHRS
jgi:hygromycin-B 4-O-kinase